VFCDFGFAFAVDFFATGFFVVAFLGVAFFAVGFFAVLFTGFFVAMILLLILCRVSDSANFVGGLIGSLRNAETNSPLILF